MATGGGGGNNEGGGPHSAWGGFYRKTLRERQAQLALAFPALFSSAGVSTVAGGGVSNVANGVAIGGAQDSAIATNTTNTNSNTTKNNTNSNTTANSTNNINNTNSESTFPLVPIRCDVADNMIENCVGTIGLPIGLALNFTINGRLLVIPMVIEESSVVAAVSGAAKTISNGSIAKGFEAVACERNIVFAQIQLLDVPDVRLSAAVAKIRAEEPAILRLANETCASMHRRGGGALAIDIRTIPRSRPVTINNTHIVSHWLVVHIHIDVCDAMGANCASTVAEGVAPLLAELAGARIGLRIVSNLATERLATARFQIPTHKLDYKGVPGDEVARRIVESYEWALDDPFRAVTHNKGIMNGIDAVAVATGQDWRAIEAASHAWASYSPNTGGICEMNGHLDSHGVMRNSGIHPTCTGYRPLTRYWIEETQTASPPNKAPITERIFCGELQLPISVGTCGGVLKTNPVYRYTLGILGNPSTKQLAMIMTVVGLAQNFAALRALCTEGIQRGHMSLHARNIAISAGAPVHAIHDCVAYMIESSRITLAAAKAYLTEHYPSIPIPLSTHTSTDNMDNVDDGTLTRLSHHKSGQINAVVTSPCVALSGHDGLRHLNTDTSIAPVIPISSPTLPCSP